MKKKGALFAAVSVIAIAVGIGITFAISQSNSVINNAISVSKYETVTTDTFMSPANWQAGETIPKTITVTNNSNSPVSVRIKLEEEWIASDGTTSLPLVSSASGLTMALIDFTENSGWVKDGPFYVYEADLQPNATTTSLITGVTLNTDANLDTSDNAEPTADTAYAGAEYHLKAIIQTIQASAKENWRELARIVKEKSRPDTVIDFSQKASKWNDNGLGVNRYTENGQDVYYYRGEMDGDSVLWADKCWRIVRTTYAGGTKIIYNGLPTDVDVDGETVKQCLVDWHNNTDQSAITVTGYRYTQYNTNSESPADIGYMYGQRYIASNQASRNAGTVYANDVDYDEDTGIYTLVDTFTVTDWDTDSAIVAQRYHYTCSSAATSCQQVYYMVNVGKEWTGDGVSSGIILSGEEDIEEVKNRMFANENDSRAKTIVESWFEEENLDGHVAGSYNYEDDLEDAVYCNDRSFATGTLRSKDSMGGNMNNLTSSNMRTYQSASQSANAFTPDLGCPNKNDAFTKVETATTNGKLKHKVGLPTADEILLAGVRSSSPNFISAKGAWTMTPYGFTRYAYLFDWASDLYQNTTSNGGTGLRPVVTLKAGTRVAGGDGTMANPFTIQH
ncbi:hypothetical protein J6X13_01125 [Candidatus Saccharibacteria bacterium]|nr:hypothetical protein [Candidatus Saccharibacteria bacterium]